MQYFEAVARNLNFTKASKELNVAQPSITNAIKRLESELQTELFIRDKRNVSLTEEGAFLLNRVSSLLEECNALEDEMRMRAHSKNWKLRIGVPPTLGAKLICLLYCELVRQYPSVQIDLREVGSWEINHCLEQEELDLGYMVLEEAGTLLETLPLDRGEVKVLVHSQCPLSAKGELSIEELKNEIVIGQPPKSFVQRVIMEEYKRQGIEMKLMPPPGSIITTYNLVAHRGGIAFVLGDHYKLLISNDSITSHSLNPPIYYNAGLGWKKERHMNLAAKACIKIMKEQF